MEVDRAPATPAEWWAELEQCLNWFERRARAFVGKRYRSRSLSLPAANYLVGLLGSIMPTRIAELGMGYSTIFLHRWRAVQEQKPEVWSMEHEPNWLAFMRVLCADQGIGMERVYERCAFQKRARSVEFDVILIDQGPTEQQRADDLRWVVPLLSKQGVLVFDDWHKGFPAMYKRALSRIGKWNIEVPESSRSGPGGKVLAVVRRRG